MTAFFLAMAARRTGFGHGAGLEGEGKTGAGQCDVVRQPGQVSVACTP